MTINICCCCFKWNKKKLIIQLIFLVSYFVFFVVRFTSGIFFIGVSQDYSKDNNNNHRQEGPLLSSYANLASVITYASTKSNKSDLKSTSSLRFMMVEKTRNNNSAYYYSDSDRSSLLQMDTTIKREQQQQQQTLARFHTPPSPYQNDILYYDNNKTPFGAILRGKLPIIQYDETDTLLSFKDKNPMAKFHALIIPKRYIRSVFDLNANDDIQLLYDMKIMAEKILITNGYDTDNNVKYVFHIPPFNSINHLHLHVLAPKDSLSWWGRIKYYEGTRWCTNFETITHRLESGQTPLPYNNKCWFC